MRYAEAFQARTKVGPSAMFPVLALRISPLLASLTYLGLSAVEGLSGPRPLWVEKPQTEKRGLRYLASKLEPAARRGRYLRYRLAKAFQFSNPSCSEKLTGRELNVWSK